MGEKLGERLSEKTGERFVYRLDKMLNDVDVDSEAVCVVG